MVKNLGLKWFKSNLLKSDGFFKIQIVNELIRHKENGGQVVFVSGSFPPCVSPVAKHFGVEHVLSTDLEVLNGVYTGKINPPQIIGKGKAEAIRRFLEQRGYHDYERCFAYGDHMSDLSMLELVGHPRVVAGDNSLEAHAKTKGWEIL